ncbi:MAG: hypothetical protein HC879_22805 [Leptolyngbyaceae cyanobacterium SL_5_9]|nr:hypothetical protein [Leptolyngbyaceae cyanobacterium SM1_4_3]NJN60104.1 hypothetical protein [Leptolyngbyaceae cyanobacterium SL_5_9]
MDEQQTAKILLHSSNSGVVQMPGRKFPEIAIQGDSLSNLFDQVRYCLQQAKQHQDEEAYYEILMLAEMLQGQLLNYESALIELGMERPYSPSIQERLIQDDFSSS